MISFLRHINRCIELGERLSEPTRRLSNANRCDRHLAASFLSARGANLARKLFEFSDVGAILLRDMRKSCFHA